MEFVGAWLQGLELFQQIRAVRGASCRACVRHSQMITLFPTEPTQRLGVLPTLAGQAAAAHPEAPGNANSFTIFVHRFEVSRRAGW